MIHQEPFDVERYKTILFKTFQAFIDTCEKYNLRYFCAGGTVLGAVRHGNIIPWDDDIDVFMPRDDYERLIELSNEISKGDYSVIAAKITPMFATFAKFYDKSTTLWELKEIPFVYGIYIDIFPLDESCDSQEEFLKKYMRLRNAQRWYQLSQMKFNISDIFSYLRQGDMKYFYKGILSYFFPRFTSSLFRKYLLTVEGSFIGQRGESMVCPYGEYFKKEYQKKVWYDDYKELPFGSLKVRVPFDYDAFLTHVYGDYMKLPPQEKQVSHHYHYFLDMNKGMTLEEIKKVLANKKKES